MAGSPSFNSFSLVFPYHVHCGERWRLTLQAVVKMSVTSLIYLSFLSLLTLPSPSHAAASCYFPDTTEASHDFPCYPDRDISVCCGPGFACLPNGICEVTAAAVNPGVSYPLVRGSCTDKTWASTACPQFCVTTGCKHLGIRQAWVIAS